MNRRTFAAQGTVAAAAALVAVVGGGLAAGIGRWWGAPRRRSVHWPSGATASTTHPPVTTPRTSRRTDPDRRHRPASSATRRRRRPRHRPPPSPPRPPGTAIGQASQVPVGGAGSFNDPSTGDPSLVIQPQAGTFLAFDAVCPHAGCTVQYDDVNKVFVCPCHGSQFNADTGSRRAGAGTDGAAAHQDRRGTQRRALRRLTDGSTRPHPCGQAGDSPP